MSLDITLRSQQNEVPCKHCVGTGKVTMTETYFDINITHNLGAMAREAGVYEAMWHPEEKYPIAGSLIPVLSLGLALLQQEPLRFTKLNPQNGWGNYEHLCSVVSAYLTACKEYPDAMVEVSR